MSAEPPIFCARCLIPLTSGRGEYFVVQITAVADPTPPEIQPEDLQRDIRAELNSLVQQLSDCSERELLDQVCRRTTIQLCNRCFRIWIENPTGSP